MVTPPSASTPQDPVCAIMLGAELICVARPVAASSLRNSDIECFNPIEDFSLPYLREQNPLAESEQADAFYRSLVHAVGHALPCLDLTPTAWHLAQLFRTVAGEQRNVIISATFAVSLKARNLVYDGAHLAGLNVSAVLVPHPLTCGRLASGDWHVVLDGDTRTTLLSVLRNPLTWGTYVYWRFVMALDNDLSRPSARKMDAYNPDVDEHVPIHLEDMATELLTWATVLTPVGLPSRTITVGSPTPMLQYRDSDPHLDPPDARHCLSVHNSPFPNADQTLPIRTPVARDGDLYATSTMRSEEGCQPIFCHPITANEYHRWTQGNLRRRRQSFVTLAALALDSPT